MRRALLLIAAGACALPGRAQTPAPEFAWAMPLEITAAAPFQALSLPPAVYEAVTRDDLGDVRVLNGAGEVVPHAFRPRSAESDASKPAWSAPLFPIRAETGASVERMDLRVETRADGAIVRLDSRAAASEQRIAAYLADLSAQGGELRAVLVELPDGAPPFVARVRLEASDDLANWRTLATGAPLLNLTAEGARLARLRIEFSPASAKYLRLASVAGSAMPELTGMRVEPAPQTAEPARDWKRIEARAGHEAEGEYRYAIGGRFPADRLRVRLPQPNTVAPVQIMTRADASGEWRALASATVYRLADNGAEVESPDIALARAPEGEILLRFDAKRGGVGASAPLVEIGWVPHRLVFAARGDPPFRLAFGSRRATPSAYRIETLVPGYGRESADSGVPALAIGNAQAGTPVPLHGPRALEEPVDAKRIALWASLGIAVTLLGVMAWRLTRHAGPGRGAAAGRDGDSAG